MCQRGEGVVVQVVRRLILTTAPTAIIPLVQRSCSWKCSLDLPARAGEAWTCRQNRDGVREAITLLTDSDGGSAHHIAAASTSRDRYESIAKPAPSAREHQTQIQRRHQREKPAGRKESRSHLAARESPNLLVGDVARQAERCEVALDLVTCTPTQTTFMT